MQRYVVLDKAVGETPLQAIQAWKAQNPDCKDTPASYAGRLDPMASGKLLILLGDECKKQEKYHNLDKEYEIEVLLDVKSDTGDALGLIEYTNKETRVDPRILRDVLDAEQAAYVRKYPAFSSKTVNGKPLFMYALEGTLNTIELPEHIERIYKITELGNERISIEALKERITDFLAKVPTTDEPSKALGADFRINEVKRTWSEFFSTVGNRNFILLKLRVTVASGTYMRSLAERIGKALGTKGIALSIHRTKIGHRRFGFFFMF